MKTRLRIPGTVWAVLLLAAAWLAVHLMAANTVQDSVFDGGLLGTDSYMRLVRVDELASGGGWFDHVIDRSNAPFGDDLHWTRPFDLMLLAIAAPLTPALGFEDALFVAGATISPLLHLGMLFALVWAVTPLVGRGRAPMAAIVLLVQPAVISHSLAGQADHHALQLLLLVLQVGLLFRLLEEPRRSGVAAASGVVAGFGIWISAETTVLTGLVAASLIAAWVYRPTDRVRGLVWFGSALVVVTAVAIVVERPPADWFAIEYDKVSLPHLASAAAVLGIAAVLSFGTPRVHSLRGRAFLAGAASVVVAVPLLLFYGGLVVGPGADVNPAIEPIWLDHVRELQPLYPTDIESLGSFLLFLGASLVALPVAVTTAWRRQDDSRLLWAAVALLIATYVVLSLLHLRFASFAAVLIAAASAEVIGQLRDWLRSMPTSVWRRAAWIGATLGLSVGFTIGGGVVSAADSESGPAGPLGCSRAAYAALDTIGGASDVTFAHINLGPEILYRTDAAIVAGPYHRNDRGILDLHRFFSASEDEVSRAVAAERDGRFVLYCQLGTTTDVYAAESGVGLYARLEADEPPDWLTLVAIGEGDDTFRLYEVEADQ